MSYLGLSAHSTWSSATKFTKQKYSGATSITVSGDAIVAAIDAILIYLCHLCYYMGKAGDRWRWAPYRQFAHHNSSVAI